MFGDSASGVNCVQSKIVIVGDCGCGKTTLIRRYTHNEFVETYTPTGFDTYTAIYNVSDTYQIKMSIWDTSGDPGYDRVRPLSYTDADLVIITFSIGDPDSIHNIVSKWKPEVRDNCPNQPIMLVGCKSDLRNDLQNIKDLSKKKQTAITYEQGLNLAKQTGFLVYSETSSKMSQRSVTDVIEVAALSSAGNRQSATMTFKRQRSFMKRKRFSGVVDAKVQLRKDMKSCSIM